jgi:hypothetical protein
MDEFTSSYFSIDLPQRKSIAKIGLSKRKKVA